MKRGQIKSARFCAVALLVLFSCEGKALADYVAGRHYFGRNDYIEYIAGNAPVILAVPHGGALTPAEIPNRTWGTLATDRNTDKLARAFVEAFHTATGRYPHVILCRLKRIKLDANRAIDEAAQGSAWAEQAWQEWHDFIDAAKDAAVKQAGSGLFIDLHGHAHANQRLELGYCISGSLLKLCDVEIANYKNRSSLRALTEITDTGFGELLRGPHSFGALMAARGFPCVPSPEYPDAGGQPYFSGGYNTRRHAGRADGAISGFQLECNFKGVRDTEENRARAAMALVESVTLYLAIHYSVEVDRLTEEVLTAAAAN
ncbi:MAG: hypothetical protein IH624_16645 [Phycisphaerae bacterium]|nr:hypothetical protein [Phycisphaerae bacterium]